MLLDINISMTLIWISLPSTYQPTLKGYICVITKHFPIGNIIYLIDNVVTTTLLLANNIWFCYLAQSLPKVVLNPT